MVRSLYVVHSKEMGRRVGVVERVVGVQAVDVQVDGGQGVDKLVVVDWLVVVGRFVALVLDAQHADVE